jgi:hypothetical protein
MPKIRATKLERRENRLFGAHSSHRKTVRIQNILLNQWSASSLQRGTVLDEVLTPGAVSA